MAWELEDTYVNKVKWGYSDGGVILSVKLIERLHLRHKKRD